jgi:hypothetical protein
LSGGVACREPVESAEPRRLSPSALIERRAGDHPEDGGKGPPLHFPELRQTRILPLYRFSARVCWPRFVISTLFVSKENFMKIVSASVVVAGVLALVLAIVERLCSFQVHGVAAGSFLRLAVALFLLALVVMCYGKCYCCCCKEEPKPQP